MIISDYYRAPQQNLCILLFSNMRTQSIMRYEDASYLILLCILILLNSSMQRFCCGARATRPALTCSSSLSLCSSSTCFGFAACLHVMLSFRLRLEQFGRCCFNRRFRACLRSHALVRAMAGCGLVQGKKRKHPPSGVPCPRAPPRRVSNE